MDTNIDNQILEFGEFYEFEKRRFGAVGLRGHRGLDREVFNSIVKGQFRRSDGRDWIVSGNNRVELSKASSGQQEALPLLFAIGRFPGPNRTLIIEEPEAHLFPNTQVEILKLIHHHTLIEHSDTIITTHSPYLLTALNNCIARLQAADDKTSWIHRDRAYCIDNGKSRDIVDEDGFVDTDYIDSVSETLIDEFVEHLDV